METSKETMLNDKENALLYIPHEWFIIKINLPVH